MRALFIGIVVLAPVAFGLMEPKPAADQPLTSTDVRMVREQVPQREAGQNPANGKGGKNGNKGGYSTRYRTARG